MTHCPGCGRRLAHGRCGNVHCPSPPLALDVEPTTATVIEFPSTRRRCSACRTRLVTSGGRDYCPNPRTCTGHDQPKGAA